MNFGTSTISQNFLFQLKNIYKQGILQLGTGKVIKDGINGYCDSAISAYPLAVATWESLIHETILSKVNFLINKNSKINSIPIELIDKWDILTKSVVVPDLLYNKSFNKGEQPFQDFTLLTSLRNSLVHFKLDVPNKKTENAIKDLSQRNIFLSNQIEKNENEIIIEIWPHMISSTEGIRWAINNICEMANILYDIIPENQKNIFMHIDNFKKIDDNMTREYFISLGVDPDSKNPK